MYKLIDIDSKLQKCNIDTIGNIIFHGPNMDKKNIFYSWLYNTKSIHNKILPYKLKVKDKNFVIHRDYYCYYIDYILDKINQTIFLDIINLLVEQQTINKEIKYIVINNLSKLSTHNQRGLNLIINKHYKNNRIIFIVNSINWIIPSLKGRCHLIRCPIKIIEKKQINNLDYVIESIITEIFKMKKIKNLAIIKETIHNCLILNYSVNTICAKMLEKLRIKIKNPIHYIELERKLIKLLSILDKNNYFLNYIIIELFILEIIKYKEEQM